MPLPSPAHRHARHAGFTLLEVLMAVGVIAILMAIIIPAITGAQNSAKRAKTRVQFSQWSAAIEQFRQEYGYYPNLPTNLVNAGDDSSNLDAQHRFHDILAGRRRDGSALPTTGGDETSAHRQNSKRITFATFGVDDVTAQGSLQDAFGNIQIVVLVDKNLSGAITFKNPSPDYALNTIPPTVQSIGGEPVNRPLTEDTIIRAGVAFYSAGDGKRPVTSW